MKAKTFVILLIVCGILGLLAFQISAPRKPDRIEGKNTGPLLPDLPVNDVTDITLQYAGGETRLVKGSDVWQVESRYAYPADFAKIADFVRKLKDLQIGRSFTATDDIVERQSLRMPDQPAVPEEQKAVRVTLKDRSGKVLADFLVGKGRESTAGAGGHYVMPASGKTVFLVDKNMNRIETDAAEWLQQNLVDVPADSVSSVRCVSSDGQIRYVLKRPEKGKDPQFENLPEGKTAPPSKLTPVFSALSALKFEDVADPALPDGQTGLGQAPCLEYALFDGTVYTVCVGKPSAENEEEGYVHIAVRFEPLPEPATGAEKTDTPKAAEGDGEQAAAAPETEDAKKSDPAKPAEAAEALQKKIDPWVYVLPKWKMDRLVTDPESLFETPKTDTQS